MERSKMSRRRMVVVAVAVVVAGASALPVRAGLLDGRQPLTEIAMSTVRITMAGNGAGKVTVTPVLSTLLDAATPVLPAGTECETNCRVSYVTGTTVKIVAQAGTRSVFTGWGADSVEGATPLCRGTGECTIVMLGHRDVRAHFTPLYTLTVDVIAISPGGSHIGATMTTLDGTVRCRILEVGTCSADYLEGTTVQLHADPDEDGFTWFGGYSGDCAERGLDCSLLMTSDKLVHTSWGSGTCGATEDQLHAESCGGGSTPPTT
jgi:hypothetical protein